MGENINQIEKCIEMLKKNGHTRRAQAVTWQAWKDLGIVDATCLQRCWFRVENQKCETCNATGEIPHGLCTDCEGAGNKDVLNMNVTMRSNDLFKGTFSNIYVFTELQKWMADQIGVGTGSYTHYADSLHLYGSYFQEIDGFLRTLETRTFEERTYKSSFARSFFVDGCNELLENEPDMPEDMKEKVRERKSYLESIS